MILAVPVIMMAFAYEILGIFEGKINDTSDKKEMYKETESQQMIKLDDLNDKICKEFKRVYEILTEFKDEINALKIKGSGKS